jgi:LuxR family maltose regulon positive regulatory protein
MMQLLLEVYSHEIMPDYTNKLLADFIPVQKHSSDNPSLPESQNQHRSDSSAQAAFSPVQPLFEPLSQREKDILRMLQTELTGPEIARELVIALSTVRTHTKRIYSKLNVNNRRAAVKRATEMNLI